MTDRPRDADAKAILRKRWPRTTYLCGREDDNRQWLRCQPTLEQGITHPRLRAPGSKLFSNQPDGLYALFGKHGQYGDVVAIEVCSSAQNLNDKRSRYAASTSSVVLNTPSRWLSSKCFEKQRWWQASRAFEESEVVNNLSIPVRHTRVLYVLPNDQYEKRIGETVCEGHEYYAPYSSLSSITAEQFRLFLARMSPYAHYYSTKVSRLGARPRRSLEVQATDPIAAAVDAPDDDDS